jgi:SulP family sulfate permease
MTFSDPPTRTEQLLPALAWLRRYRLSDLRGDLTAGLTVAVMLIPQGMAYALLAGLPPVVGLYAATFPLMVYAFFGSSRQLAVGPVAIVSLLTLTGVSAVAEAGTAGFALYAALLALMVGAAQLLLGVLRAGFITNFLSHAVVSGFTSAAAVVIALSQLKDLLGIRLENTHSVPLLLWEAATRLGETNPVALALGAASILLLLLGRRFAPRLPVPLGVVVLATLATYGLGLDNHGLRIVGEVPSGLPQFTIPPFDAAALVNLLPAALTISFVGFMESFAVAKLIAARERYALDANAELRALGLANLVAGVFSAYPVTGGFSRTAVNYQAGARTGLASIITALLVLLTLLFFTPLFYYLPNAALAAIVVVAVVGLVDLKEPHHLFRVRPIDGWTLLLTFAATLLIGIEQGILIGVAFSLLVYVWRSAYPHTAVVGYLESEGVFRNVARFPQVRLFPGTVIIREDAALYFANMAFLEGFVEKVLRDHPDAKRLLFDFSGVNDVDAVALDTLRELMSTLETLGVEVHLAGMKGPVRDLVDRAGWPARFRERAAHLSLEHALRDFGEHLSPAPNAPTGPRAVPAQAPLEGR